MGPSFTDWISEIVGAVDSGRRCSEAREYFLPASVTLRIDASPNGGIRVRSGPEDGIRVVATVETHGTSPEDARDLAPEVNIELVPGEIRSTGPRGLIGFRYWAVSYDVTIPAATGLWLRSSNGRLAVEGTRGSLDLQTANGGIDLQDVAGAVRARTANGGVTIALADGWNGDIRAETTNGGIRLVAPEGIGANLEAETTNGGIHVDFPLHAESRTGRQLQARLGAGGPLIHLATTNGGVRVRRK